MAADLLPLFPTHGWEHKSADRTVEVSMGMKTVFGKHLLSFVFVRDEIYHQLIDPQHELQVKDTGGL